MSREEGEPSRGYKFGGDTYVVLFGLEPIEGLLGTICTVSRDSVRLSVVWVCPTATSKLGCGKPDGGGGVGDSTLESVHVVWVNVDKNACREYELGKQRALCSEPLSGE